MIGALSRFRIPGVGALAVVFSTGCVLSAQQRRTVVLEPGQDIQAIVESSPEGRGSVSSLASTAGKP
jgi:hypothetical protein